MFWYKILKAEKLSEGDSIFINSKKYILLNDILRQVKVYSYPQRKTNSTFRFKWSKRETYESDNMKENSYKWLLDRYLGRNKNLLNVWLKPGSKFLDAGCGAGYSTLLLFQKRLNRINYLGVDSSEAIDIASKRFKENNIKGEFIQADITDLPFNAPIFDVIFSEGVLHHTNSVKDSIKYLSRLLLQGGRFLFYVYKKKAVIREFVDDYVRKYLEKLNDEQAWKALIPLTRIGKVIGDLNIKINVPEEIPFLEIPAGEIELQRFFYWYIFKIYYKSNWSIEELNHINFDWYRPTNCHRHTPQQIIKWCTDSNLSIENIKVEEAGINVVAMKL